MLANKTFLQRLQLPASGLQALQCPLSLFFLTFKAIQQLTREPSTHSEECMDPGKDGHRILRSSDDYKLCSSRITVSADARVTNEN